MAQWNPAMDFLRGREMMSRMQDRDRQAELRDRRMTLAEAQAERQGEAHDLSMETNRFKLNELERARERENIQDRLRGLLAPFQGDDGRITDPRGANLAVLQDEDVGPFMREALASEVGIEGDIVDFLPHPNQDGLVVPMVQGPDGQPTPYFDDETDDGEAVTIPEDSRMLESLLAEYDPERYAGLLDARAQHRQRQGQAGLLESMIGEQEQPIDALNRRIDAEMERIDRGRPAVVDDIERQRGEVMRDAGLMGALSTPRGVEVRDTGRASGGRDRRDVPEDASMPYRIGASASEQLSRYGEYARDIASRSFDSLRSAASDPLGGMTTMDAIAGQTGDLERGFRGEEPRRPREEESSPTRLAPIEVGPNDGDAPAQEVEVSRPIPGREADGPNLRERRQQLEGMDEFRQELERAREQGSQRQATAQRQHATRRRLAKDLTQAVSDGVVDLDGAMSIWESVQPDRAEPESATLSPGQERISYDPTTGREIGRITHSGEGADDVETRQTYQNRLNAAVEAVGGGGDLAAGIMMLEHEGQIPGINGKEQIIASQLTDIANSAVRREWNIFAPWTYGAIPENIRKRFTVGRRDSIDDFSAAEYATMANALRMGYQNDLPSFQSDFMQPIGRLAEDGHISQPDAVMTGLAETYVEMTQGRNPVSHDRALALLRQQLSNPEAMAELEQEYGGRR